MKKFYIILEAIALIIFIAVFSFHYFISPMYEDTVPIESKPVEILSPLTPPPENTSPIPTEDIDFEIIPIYREEQKSDEIINIVLIGMDARNYKESSRSDTIILASYNKTKKTVKLLSLMRDSYVYIPDKYWGKINSATAIGGVGLLINTINQNFDLDVQNYIEVKFDDFKEIINLLGGIDMKLSKKEVEYINNKLHTEDKDWNNDLEYNENGVHLNGTQTLWHCRNRSIGNSDFERTQRQRDVLSVIIQKALKMDLQTAMNVINSVVNHVKTNVPIDTIVDIVKNVLIDKELDIETSRVPFETTYNGTIINGASVLEIDIEENKKMIHEFLGYN